MVDMVATPKPWPHLREDLTIYAGPRSHDGEPTWTLYDPASHRYFRLGWLEFEYLQRWSYADAEQIALAINAQSPLTTDVADIEDFIRFLATQQLLQASDPADCQRLAQHHLATQTGFWTWLLHHYLFMRLPLLRPDPYLKRLRPLFNPLFSRQFFGLIVAVTLLAVYLLGQQWAAFSHALQVVLTPEGLLSTALMLSLTKLVHEVGHAVAASHFGCRVPTMGVALLMGLPVLWTDVSDAWRLPSRQQRLLIDAAGMIAELALAALASVLWVMLPEGALRNGTYLLASTAWVLTLTINLNPFMRFDGYYLLSDALDIANLQDRAFALARWQLREYLFRFNVPAPEHWRSGQRRLLLAYAYGTWGYRLLLFAGIAWAVYHFFFKALGLGLFAVEIGWFIIRPIAKEIAVWRVLHQHLKTPWTPRWSWIIPLSAVVLMFIPWHTQLIMPGLLRADTEQTLYSPQAAQVKRVFVQDGDSVVPGQVLIELGAPDLDFKRQDAQQRLAALNEQLAAHSLELALARHNPMAVEALQSTLAELQGLDAAAAKLTITATIAGQVRDWSDVALAGAWLAKDEVIGIVASHPQTVVAYTEEADLNRLKPGATGYFYPDGGDLPPLKVRIAAIDRTGTRQLTLTELASTYGGAVAVREDPAHHLIPELAVYRITLNTDYAAPLALTVRGRLSITTPPESLIGRLIRSAIAVLVRESSW